MGLPAPTTAGPGAPPPPTLGSRQARLERPLEPNLVSGAVTPGARSDDSPGWPGGPLARHKRWLSPARAAGHMPRRGTAAPGHTPVCIHGSWGKGGGVGIFLIKRFKAYRCPPQSGIAGTGAARRGAGRAGGGRTSGWITTWPPSPVPVQVISLMSPSWSMGGGD